MTTKNPFRPGVGLQPTYLAGRDADIATFKKVLQGAPDIPANVRMTGLRGVGKTVLLKRFQEIAEDEGWASINVEIEPRHGSDEAFSRLIQDQLQALNRRLSVTERVKSAASSLVDAARKAATVSQGEFTWSLAGDLDAPTKAVADSILQAVTVARGQWREGVVLLFDEAQILVDEKDPSGNHPLSSLIAAVSTLQKQHIRVALVLCGLPTLAVNLLSARTYTERMFRGLKIGSLTTEDSLAALTEPLANTTMTMDGSLAQKVVSDVAGYPYFIQLWGAELWDATHAAGLTEITPSTLDVIEPEIISRLDLDFYLPRIESLTPAEQDLLQDTVKCSYPPIRVSDLNGASKKSAGNINVLLGRLVAANILYRPRKGEYHYTAPKFRDFLIRRESGQDDGY